MQPRNSTIRAILLYAVTSALLTFPMRSPQAPTLLLPNDIEPRLFCPSLCTREIPSFVFILLRIPFPATPFVSHPYKSPGGVTHSPLPPSRLLRVFYPKSCAIYTFRWHSP